MVSVSDEKDGLFPVDGFRRPFCRTWWRARSWSVWECMVTGERGRDDTQKNIGDFFESRIVVEFFSLKNYTRTASYVVFWLLINFINIF